VPDFSLMLRRYLRQPVTRAGSSGAKKIARIHGHSLERLQR
jgi:hypothetical protein